MQEIIINQHKIGSQHPPFIIAELSGNHQHSLAKAIKLVETAHEIGAHAIKLQTYTPDTITMNCLREEFVIKEGLWKARHLYELYQEAHLPWEWHEPILKRCKELKILAFSTPFDETAVDFLEKLEVPCYKIASLEIIDLPLIRKAAATKKPLILSTGAASLAEIDEAVSVARKAGCRDLILLKCTTAYPAEATDSNLRTIPHLAECFKTLVGISDHTLGIGVALAGIALGACVIEKHFTLSRQDGGVDDAFSLEPHEFKMLVTESKRAWQALGRIEYSPMHSEELSFSLRPSLYFDQELQVGDIVLEQHVKSIRPNRGLPPKEIGKIIGLKLAHSVKKGTPVSWELFKKN